MGLGLQGRETCVRFLQAADQELRAAAVRRERERESMCVCAMKRNSCNGAPNHQAMQTKREAGSTYVRVGGGVVLVHEREEVAGIAHAQVLLDCVIDCKVAHSVLAFFFSFFFGGGN